MKEFSIVPANDSIWNLTELTQFLIQHQHQDIMLNTKGEGCCCGSIGLYDLLDQFEFGTVTIRTANTLETHDRYNIKIDLPWVFLELTKQIETKYHKWNKNKIFGTVYGRPLWHRIGLASHLHTYHNGLSQIGCLANPASTDSRQLFEVVELFKNDVPSFQNFANMLNRLPMQIDEVDNDTPGVLTTDGYVAQTKAVYKNFLIDIVAETFTSGNCFFVTEKTVRPMLLKKPFVHMGSKNYLDYLHQMGFRTFSDFWSEEYDGYEGQERYIRILKLIDQLAQIPINKLEQMYWDMQYTLDHNYNLLLTQTYKREIVHLS